MENEPCACDGERSIREVSNVWVRDGCVIVGRWMCCKAGEKAEMVQTVLVGGDWSPTRPLQDVVGGFRNKDPGYEERMFLIFSCLIH